VSVAGRLGRSVRFAGVVGLLAASIAPALAEEPASANHMVTGPVLTPPLVPAGWVSDHLASWISERPAYGETCQTDAVVDELHYLQQLVGRDQDLRDTARAQLMHPVREGDSTAKRHTDIAFNALMPLDDDISAIDRLTVRLATLPACGSTPSPPIQATASAAPTPPASGQPAPQPAAPPAPAPDKQPPAPDAAVAAHVPAIPSQQPAAETAATNAPAPATPPQQPTAQVAAANPPPPATPLAAPAEPATPVATETAPAAAPEAAASDKPAAAARDDNLFVVRFDHSGIGLTPLSIRKLDAALNAVDAGRPVRMAIDGCETPDNVSEGVDCTALTRRLKRILADRGVDHPEALIAKPR
jgi:outer membrane biosynthesis protein TonB